MMVPKRVRSLIVVGILVNTVVLLLWWFDRIPVVPAWKTGTPPIERPPGPYYKHKQEVKKRPPISDNFPFITNSTEKLPAIAPWNQPPTQHVKENTPLFIGFTRNWPVLQQVVLSYIAAGWPSSDIYVVDNTGTLMSNFPPEPKLSLQNPHYLNVPRLRDVFGVNVLSTPTLLTFAQLQNFYIFTCLEKGWDYYFWGHMDVIVVADEKWDGVPYRSFYGRAVDKLREATSPDYLLDPATGIKAEWGIQFFAYDWLALNNVQSFMKIGAWDSFISYYTVDCDMHGRFEMAGIKMPVADAGLVLDVGGSIDLNLLFRRKGYNPKEPPKTVEEFDKLSMDERSGDGYKALMDAIQVQVDVKSHGKEERNSWQYKQTGGQGEPFYRDPAGFEKALQMAIKNGVETYQEKWGHKTCNLHEGNLKTEDAWQVEHDFVD